jgi:hypothetical protein
MADSLQGGARLGLVPEVNLIEVSSLVENRLRALAPNGTLEGTPFMPEMAAFCGQRRAGSFRPCGKTLQRLEINSTRPKAI